MPETAPNSERSAFSCALEKYIELFPKESKKFEFIQKLKDQQANGLELNRTGVIKELQRLGDGTEKNKAARATRNALNPVVKMLTQYTGMVDTMIQADPMPSALIWGSFKVVIQASSQFLDLYTKISDQIDRLCAHIEVLTGSEDLFGDSEAMYELLKTSYVSIIMFWQRVEKECKRGVPNRMARAFVPHSITKIDALVAKIGNTAHSMSQLIPIVKGRLERNEREDAAKERRQAGIFRADISQKYEEEFKRHQEDRKQQRRKDVLDWICAGSSGLNQSNYRHQKQKNTARGAGTCEWLLENEEWKCWVDAQSPASKLLIKADPGVGKSVLASYAVETLPKITPNGSAIIHQYYTIDDEFPALLVYRCLAEQLANELGKLRIDMPEDIHTFTQHGATSARSEDVQKLIESLIEALPVTYVILDGLDEMCETKYRRNDVCDVIKFLQQLTTNRLRVWYSSQSRTWLDSILPSLPSIEVTKALNNSDIEKYLSEKIVSLDRDEINEDLRNSIPRKLCAKADGCFLWASLMLDSIDNKANSLTEIEEIIENELPGDYEQYYQRKMEAIESDHRKDVSLLLACIVHAKRPLQLEELCECKAMAQANEGHDLDRRDVIFKRKILSLCQPLVQVHESERETGDKISICTLIHRTVRVFLLKNPDILKHGPASNAYALDSKPMADICLKYLLQPRYSRLLRKSRGNDTYIDLYNSDIMDHRLLTYAAKYWDRHYDEVEGSLNVFHSVSRLLGNIHFFTLLQVQSLFVEGHFTNWLNGSRPWAGRHFRRTFPSWLKENYTEVFNSNYESFVSEWGSLLDKNTRMYGSHEGEIDRCFFGALGSDNVLHKGPSRYKSVKFLENEGKTIQAPMRCFDAINANGTQLRVVKMEKLSTKDLVLTCERWELNDTKGTLQGVQWLRVSSENWPLYEYPLSPRVFGRPEFVSFSSDLQYMRIGSHLFMQGDDLEYKLLPISEIYFDEMAGKGNFLALTTRRPVDIKDIAPPENATSENPVDCAEIMLHWKKEGVELCDEIAKELPRDSAESAQSTQPTATSSTDRRTDETPPSTSSALANDPDKSESMTDEKSSNVTTTDKLLFQSSSESAGNSAYTSWSEGSTEPLSDDMEEDDQWNDWDDQKLNPEELDIEDRGSLKSDDGQSVEADIESHLSASGSDIGSVGEHSYLNATRNDPRRFFFFDTDSDDSEDEGGGERLEEMMLGRGAGKGDGSKRISIRLYDATRPESVPVFHYNGFVKEDLFDSPPVLHPTKPLLVWPLGDGEILFANYQENTYFTRGLVQSTKRICYVFIKAHFSSNGRYLHLAALEASGVLGKDKPSVKLNLQVSTHRLSSRKTASSPPRLIFHKEIDAGAVPCIPVSDLPFFVTWTDRELFFLNRGNHLDITRIPLFHNAERTSPLICSLKEPIFLPRSTVSRSMRFVPAPGSSISESGSTADREGTKGVASLVLGSYSSCPARRGPVPKNICDTPIAVFFREGEDGDLVWHCKPTSGEVNERPPVNSACGRLKGKFESFNQKEDCDIVPYFV